MKTRANPNSPIFYPTIEPPRIFISLTGRAARAGFPSPADDYTEDRLDLNELMIQHQAATFFARAKGQSMQGAGIEDGDYLVVDKAITPICGNIVVAAIDGELLVKRYMSRQGRIWLDSASPDFPSVMINEGQELTVWGVVTGIVRRL